MEGSAIGFLIKALVYQFESAFNRPLLVSLAFFILLAFTRVESLMETSMVWLAPTREFLDRPTLAFLLLNCVIATIIARSKLGIGEPGHEEENQRGTMRQINGKRDEKGDFVAEIATEEKCHIYLDTQIQRGYGQYPYGEHPLRKRWSAHACNNEDYLAKHNEQAIPKKVIKKKPSKAARNRAVGRRNDEVELCHPNSLYLRDDMRKQQPMIHRGRLSSIQYSSEAGSSQYEKPTHQNSIDPMTPDTCLSRSAEHPAAEAAATAHPSMEEVWAAYIMESYKSNKTSLPMACNPQAKLLHSSEVESVRKFNQPQLNAAVCKGAPIPRPAPAAVLALDPPTPSRLHSSSLSPAQAATTTHPERGPRPHPGVSSRPRKSSGRDELEELNRRADQFIAAFNRKMRLQREQSLERQKTGRRLCNYEVQYPEHPCSLRAPIRGLLMG